MIKVREKWQTLVNMVMSIRLCKMWEIFLLAKELLDSHEGLCYVDLIR
jgi:hypothetical protein